ncbi:hypothetical protein [Pseudomonas sp. 28 E 9]|nr:hypothetical protein [Pseudomonas sp. 28 E 9]CRM64971.1 hypothetical protein [Pseudomonas sp. 28 E 9]
MLARAIVVNVLDIAADHAGHQLVVAQCAHVLEGAHEAPVLEHRHRSADTEHFFHAVRDIEHHFALIAQARNDRHQAINLTRREAAGRLIEGNHVGATGQRLGDFHQLALAQGQAAELFLGIDFIGQALEARQRLLAQHAAVDHAKTRRQMPEEQVLGHGHFRHQVQLLVDHRHAAGNAVGGVLEGHDLLADLHRAAAGNIGAAEDLQQRRFTRTVLAHQGVHLPRVRGEADAIERLDPREGFADTVKTQGRSGHFHSPILVSSSWKLARVIRVTSSMAVYLAGSLPVVTHSYIASAVL